MPNDTDFDALQGFIAESNDSLQAIESDFIGLENDPGNSELINNIFRPVHSLKGNSGFFGLTNINKFAHRLENLLDFIRKGELSVTKEIIDLLLGGIDHLKEMLARARENPNDVEMRADEEHFLARVEAHRPKEIVGTIQSVIEFEEVLKQALDEGMIIEDLPMIANLLTKIEKSSRETREYIAEIKKSKNLREFSEEDRYLMADEDWSGEVVKLIAIDRLLTARQGVPAAQITQLNNSLHAFGPLQKKSQKIQTALEELVSLANFLDDPLMTNNNDFNSSCRACINKIISCFTIIPTGDSGGDKIGEILVDQKLATPENINAVLAKQKKIGQLLIEEGVIKEEDLKKALQIQGHKALAKHIQDPAGREISKTIRIDQDKLDNFADAIGDLFINLESFGFLKRQMLHANVDLRLVGKLDNTIRTIDKVVERLHDNVMGIRRVPLKGLFQRFPRVIRQLASALDKQVNLIIKGDETLIDKDLLEKIENPMVHLLRNAIDHGLELPAQRIAKGKPAMGSLELTAHCDENNVTIKIADDGNGIDPEKMKQVALDKKFLPREELERLSPRELVNLVFRPGFSSTRQVSDISGRGVGMDVVFSGLKECNGTIDLESLVNQGTTVTLTVPLTRTLVTRDAMIIRADNQLYALPSEAITTVIETTNIIPVFKDGCIAYDNSILRVVDINSFFNHSACDPIRPDSLKTFALSKNYEIAIMVDQVVNHQKVVVKEFRDGYSSLHNIDGITGYTILGDDEVILIIDIEKLARQALNNKPI